MRDLKKEYGAFPSKSQIAKYMRKRRAFIDELMAGIEPLSDGRSQRYFVGDVAEMVMLRGFATKDIDPEDS